MLRIAFSVALFVGLGIGSASAQSGALDFSTPMTGKSIFAIDENGQPFDRGVPVRAVAEDPVEATGNEADRRLERGTVGVGSGGGSAVGAKTVPVRGYVRKDGTTVRPHMRSAPTRGGGGGRGGGRGGR